MPPFENTAPQRKKDTPKTQFRALRGQLTLSFGRAARDPDPGTLRAWNSYVPLAPRTAYDVLTRGLPEETQVKITDLDCAGQGSLTIQKFDDEQGGELFSDERPFDLRLGEVEMGMVSVSPDYQGRGLGRALMRNQIEFFHACAVRRFNIVASSANGGYTWARMGFLPQDIRAPRLRDKEMKKVHEKIALLRPLLTKADLAVAEDAAQLRRATDLWRLADLRTDMAPALAKAIRKNDKLRDMVSYQFHRAQEGGYELPLGRLLLSGASWDGTLDLENRRQMKRVDAYCGGFRYIKLR